MQQADLFQVVNSGRAWAFIGSGASTDAGCPSWKDLVNRVVEETAPDKRTQIQQDPTFISAFEETQYPKCFSRIQHFIGRDALVQVVRDEMGRHTQASEIHRAIVDWPFAGYITINYDTLLETALLRYFKETWVPVGNTDPESKKVSGDASGIVWHIHGSVELPEEKSRLVISEEDYDDFYLEDRPVLLQLRALLAQRRVVFLGFGFKDPEVMRLLKRVGRMLNPARPVLGFLGGLLAAEHSDQRRELLDKYNVNVISYNIENGSHRQLVDLLNVYGGLILKRSLKFGHAEQPCPSYDPETTGLLIYNELCMKGQAKVSGDIIGTLLRARILSSLKYKVNCTKEGIVTDLNDRTKLMKLNPRSRDEVSLEVQAVLDELNQSGLVQPSGDDALKLTQKGRDAVEHHSSQAELYSAQFVASLKSRAGELLPGQPEAAARVARGSEAFIKDCVICRSLGVAMAQLPISSLTRNYHMVALLQNLPKYMEQLEGTDEAIALSTLVQSVFAAPKDSESKYIGMALQAQFGVHLLGYDPPTLQVRARELSETSFLVDSSTLIQFLARSSRAYKSARMLVSRLKSIGCETATTDLFVDEVVGHISWAVDNVSLNGRISQKTLEAATGRAGEWINAFLEGFLEEVNSGKLVDFFEYLGSTLGTRHSKGGIARADIERVLVKEGLAVKSFRDWDGFADSLFAERDKEEERITEERALRSTYKGERQVRAEAEALLIIRLLREGILRWNHHQVSNAYFLSHSRVLDEVAKPGLAVTMRPESVIQWVATLRPCSPEELEGLTSSLFCELAERNLLLVNRKKLRNIFADRIDASKSKLLEVLEKHRELIAEAYGEPAIQNFRDADDLDVPFVLENFEVQQISDLKAKLEAETRARIAAQTQKRLTDTERTELNILRARDQHRRAKAQKNKRRAASRPSKKRKKRKKR